MKMTQREFRIAVGAALFGFFLCYFLFGTTQPPRSAAPQMTVIASLPKTSLPKTAPTNARAFELRAPSPRTNRHLLRYVPTFGIKNRPELLLGYQTPSLKLDLTSSRYRAEVDLSDLQ